MDPRPIGSLPAAAAGLRRSTLTLLALSAALLTVVLACSADTPGPPGATQPVAPLPESAPVGATTFPFRLGVNLVQPGGSGAATVTDAALSTQVIAGGTLVSLFAFATAAAADNADQAGTPLDPAAPADANGQADVFLSVLDSAGALKDTVLVSQKAAGGPAAGNGASRRPALTFLANAGFDPRNPQGTNPAGFVHVAFESTASDLVAPDTNAASDVFRVVIALNVDQDPGTGAVRAGALNLRFLDATAAAAVRPQRVSVTVAAAQGNGAATQAAISNDGNVIAFVSTATNLVAGDTNGVADVFARILNPATTVLVSRRSVGGFGTGGASGNPRLAGDHGEVILFESTATDLVAGDSNGVQDVFWSRLVAAGGTVTGPRRASVRTGGAEAVGGASRVGSVYPLDLALDQMLIAFESDKTDLVATRPPNTTTSVYLFDSRGSGTTTLLNQRLEPGGATLGSAQGGLLPADSHRPVFNSNGTAVLFDTLADNLDLLRPADANGSADVVLADLTFLFTTGLLRHHRLSVASDGADGNGSSTVVGAAGFTGTVAARVASNGLPVAFTARLVARFADPRCQICHGYNGTGTNTRGGLGADHTSFNQSTQCSCHQADAQVNVPCWHAPPAAFDFRGKTAAQLCAMAAQTVTTEGFGSCLAETLAPRDHFHNDDKIRWALTNGSMPNGFPARPVSGDYTQFLAEADAWIEGGFQCDDIAATASGDVLWFQTSATNLGAGATGLVIAFPSRVSTERVSKSDGFPPAGGRQLRAASRAPHLTADDRYVVFASDAAIDANDRNLGTDVYVRDLFLGRTFLVSHAAGSVAAANSDSRAPRAAVDAAGHLRVVFESRAGNLVTGFRDRNGSAATDVFLADFSGFDGNDVRTIAIQLVSHADGSVTDGGNGASEAPDVAAGSGVFVAFQSLATDLLAGFTDQNGAREPDVFRAEPGNATVLVSRSNGVATTGGNGGARGARISSDGTVLAFQSTAGDLVPGFVDGNAGGADVYRFAFSGIGTGMQLVSVAASGGTAGGNGEAIRPALSRDGLFVAFESLATDLVAGFVDGNGAGAGDVYVRDIAGSQTRLASAAAAAPTRGGNGAAARAALGSDGGVVGFESLATDLCTMTDGNGAGGTDVFVRDTGGNTTRLVSVARGSTSQGGAGASGSVSLGRPGGRIGFGSLATDLIDVGADTNAVEDVYVTR